MAEVFKRVIREKPCYEGVTGEKKTQAPDYRTHSNKHASLRDSSVVSKNKVRDWTDHLYLVTQPKP